MGKRQALLLYSLLVLCIGSRAQTFNIENDAVRQYMKEVFYSSSDDDSRVEEYNVMTNSRNDQPLPVVVKIPSFLWNYVDDGSLMLLYSIGSEFSNSAQVVQPTSYEVTLYNLLPDKIYDIYFMVKGTMAGKEKVITEGQERMVYAPSVHNVRDLGGWTTTDGRRVRYGMLFRGGELNGQHIATNEDKTRLKQLGIGAEIDLRARYEEDHGVSAFGFLDVAHTPRGQVPSFLYTNDSGQLFEHLTKYYYLYRWRQEFEFIVKNLRAGRAVYYHCRWGADRTGYLSLLLEGLLGMSYDAMMKDYEMTTFSGSVRTKESIDPVIEYIRGLEGATLQKKFYGFWLYNVGVSKEDINYFIDTMLEGDAPGKGDDLSDTIDSPIINDADETSMDKGYYDMQGHHVSEEKGHHNIYIHNGKKVMVK